MRDFTSFLVSINIGYVWFVGAVVFAAAVLLFDNLNNKYRYKRLERDSQNRSPFSGKKRRSSSREKFPILPIVSSSILQKEDFKNEISKI